MMASESERGFQLAGSTFTEHPRDNHMETLQRLQVKVFSSAFQYLMFKKPLPRKLNSDLSLFFYNQLGLAMQRQSRC